MQELLRPGLFRRGPGFYTVNLRPGEKVYGEDLVVEDGVEYRRIDPWRSKLGAFVAQGGRQWPYERVRSVLYLGGGHGTTVSHLSDILPRGTVHVVEKSPRAFGALLALSQRRENVLPVLADVQLPERYRADCGEVDHLYQDVSQRGQVEIFLENLRASLKPHGTGLLMLKTRSVTQTAPPRAVLKDATRHLQQEGLDLLETVDLAPFSRGHFALVLRAPG
ncbi:MAG: fibrillarin-like rRNA/tRNA 2'-O-methyltransferase [Euryarchaeota archaeon]|nr:fibrillarin-like rRNA/tRNA 2'-O-methyltransferase [Euryarchaeota archaeon]MDE1836786.1 fibrillarin-like rRNA/tRNA 2'-O-methyltransferase [Euryarchaeota archaeon]MDE1879804.1 fibrillarin-like rRNA/tRNA 2'-O-methyltransferase [Euryarchaeota archaeon]MDE2044770.1 fibrillarin-like rRNA/tRNA 2'-O-methyltransferase [Thermoplasmata archaeon]